MSIVEVTSRQFREKQKTMFEMADQGDKIVIRRGRKKSYVLTPLEKDDLMLSPELERRIERGIKNIKEGKGREYSLEELKIKMGL